MYANYGRNGERSVKIPINLHDKHYLQLIFELNKFEADCTIVAPYSVLCVCYVNEYNNEKISRTNYININTNNKTKTKFLRLMGMFGLCISSICQCFHQCRMHFYNFYILLLFMSLHQLLCKV